MKQQELFDLISCFEGSSLSSLKLSTQEFTLELTRAAAPCPGQSAPAPVPAKTTWESLPTVNAPLVGTFYAAPAPDQPPFVKPGDRVKKGQSLCIIEAMKMMSEVAAPCDCVIEAVLGVNGELVAFDQPLVRYRPC